MGVFISGVGVGFPNRWPVMTPEKRAEEITGPCACHSIHKAARLTDRDCQYCNFVRALLEVRKDALEEIIEFSEARAAIHFHRDQQDIGRGTEAKVIATHARRLKDKPPADQTKEPTT